MQETLPGQGSPPWDDVWGEAMLAPDDRYERGSMLITCNRSVGEWGRVFGDPVVATAILERLLHHSQVITIRGDSYRLREKRRSGLIKPTAQDVVAAA
jgi:IstB-like ATP binding protein